jgi:hypothetical protein
VSGISRGRIRLASDEVILSSHVTMQGLIVDGLNVRIGPEAGMGTDQEYGCENYEKGSHDA